MIHSNMTPQRPPNLADIAAKAGVSRSTVSRVINKKPVVSAATRQKVLAVIEQEGYAPHPVARALAAQCNHIIGVIIPQVPDVLFEDAYYFPTLLHGISKSANQRNYAILLWFGQSRHDEQVFFDRITTNQLMDGVIIASARRDSPLIDHFLHSNTPFVLVERPAHQQDKISYVTIDNFHAAWTVVSHLIVLGRKRIGMLTGDLRIIDAADRLAGYQHTLREAGYTVDDALIYQGDFTPQSGYEGMQYLLTQGVDGVFTSSDIIAQGALRALDEAGVPVPQAIAMVSIDDLPTAVRVTPALTTIQHPIEEKGAYAAEVLLKMIAEQNTAPRQIVLPTKLIIRESCGAHIVH
jgi:DNA-binding LacI/PurR family transcriptional regulator